MPKDGVHETRVISQDKATHLARVDVQWDQENDVASGIVVHKSQPDAYIINDKENYIWILLRGSTVSSSSHASIRRKWINMNICLLRKK